MPDETRKNILETVRRPLFIFLVIGLVGRLICAPLLTYDFDMYHWGVIMQNINSGNGLYELTGYFYTPVWGYIMAFIDMIWNNLMSIDVFGRTVTALFGIEDMEHIYHISTITSPAFNTAMKIPLIISDVIVGYLVYLMTEEFTGDRRKAEYAFGFWFLCPVVFYMSGVQGMFDCIAALLMMLCVYLVIKDHFFLAGVFLSVATLLKLFPGTCVFILVIYVLKKYTKEERSYNKLLLAVAGAVAALVVIMLPNILAGNLDSTLTFLTDRSERDGIGSYLLFAVVLAIIIVFAYRFAKGWKGDPDKRLVRYVLITLATSMFLVYTPQYVIVMLPFLAVCISSDRCYLVSWILIGLGAVTSAFTLNNFSLLCSVSTFIGSVPADWVVSMMHAWETHFILGNVEGFLNGVGFVLEYAGLVIILLTGIEDVMVRKYPKTAVLFSKLRKERTKEVEDVCE